MFSLQKCIKLHTYDICIYESYSSIKIVNDINKNNHSFSECLLYVQEMLLRFMENARHFKWKELISWLGSTYAWGNVS